MSAYDATILAFYEGLNFAASQMLQSPIHFYTDSLSLLSVLANIRDSDQRIADTAYTTLPTNLHICLSFMYLVTWACAVIKLANTVASSSTVFGSVHYVKSGVK